MAAPFDLLKGPLFRTRLLKVNEDEHTLFLTWHHIICDGGSAQALRWKARAIAKRFGCGCGLPASPTPVSFSEDSSLPEKWIDLSDYSEDQRRVWHRHLEALRKYQPQTYAGRVVLFRSPVHLLRCSFDPQYGWGELARGGVTQQIISSAHETIMEEPGVQQLASAFAKELELSNASPKLCS